MKQLIEDIAKALVDIPEEVDVQCGRRRAGDRARVEAWPPATWEGDRQTGPHGPLHPHHSGRGGHEAEPALHLGNSGIVNSDWVTIAVLGTTHANRGEITGTALAGKLERYRKLSRAWLFGPSGEPHQVEVESVWEHSNRLVFKFRGIDSMSDAEMWNGAEVRIPASEREPLEEGEFYFSDLVGCEVWDRTRGDRVGTVVAVREFGGPGCWSWTMGC